MSQEEQFKIEKIKGDFAELICKHHFEYMGFKMDKVGIEDLSPSFAKLSSSNNAVTSLKKLIQYMPDFLAVYPSLGLASFIEVKYRRNITDLHLVEFSKELHLRYENVMKDGIPLYFYLVTNKAPYVYIMKAYALKHKEQTGGFYSVEDNALNNLVFFQSKNKNASFSEAYKDCIKTAIVEILEA
ncbi:MAG: hypothetical protein NTZ60_00840 [Campylobacterales bacterium]|nr:hypothetical protein [Campylobacterales bacterium]